MSDCSSLELLENKNSPSRQSSASQATRESNENSIGADAICSASDSNSHHVRIHSDNLRASRSDGHEFQHDHHQRLRNNTNRIRCQSESSTQSSQLRYGAGSVIQLCVPVSLCMIIVIGTMKATDNYRYSSQLKNFYAQMMFTDQSVDTGTRVLYSFANAFLVLIFIMVMTTVLILLYKFRWYKTIHAWLILSSLMLLFFFTVMYVAEILRFYNIPVDNYTLSIFIWNFGVVGMICVHWKGPLFLQQGYLVVISALMALVLIRSLPDWTHWTVLATVSVWDLIAVLSPRGPLRVLVETAQERNESIFPALIYSSTMVWEMAMTSSLPFISMADNDSRLSSKASHRSSKSRRGSGKNDAVLNKVSATSSNRSRTDRNSNIEVSPPDGRGDAASTRDATDTGLTIDYQPPQDQSTGQVEEVEERGVKLGLGDFIFFSVLVGKASSYDDWSITMACYVSILVGLCLTLSLLAVFRKALPALPISIAFGLCSYFLSYVFIVPFAEELAINQVFI